MKSFNSPFIPNRALKNVTSKTGDFFNAIKKIAMIAAVVVAMVPIAKAAPMVNNTNDGGPGSLRYVALNASSGSTITFDSSLSGRTILLTNGEIPLSIGLTIDASSLPGGITIDGNDNSRIFEATGTSNIFIGLTLTNGNGVAANESGVGGAILAYGNLVLSNCTVAGNQASGTGGAIATVGGSLILSGTSLSNNVSGNCSGIYMQDTAASFSACTFAGNVGSDAVRVQTSGGNSTLKAINCTFSGNQASINLGAALSINGSAGNTASVVLTNCTVAGNSNDSGSGGIYVDSISGDGTNLISLYNTIVAGNTDDGSPSDIDGPVTAATSFNNLIGSGGGLTDGVNGNHVGIDQPGLAPLGNYGGPTVTMLPLPLSPVIDAGGPTSLITDQRGLPRVVGSATDIGAVESGNTISNYSIVVTVADDNYNSASYDGVTLREAVALAGPGSTITFDPTLEGSTIVLENGELLITNDVTIDASALASPITLDAVYGDRAIEIDSGTVVLNSLVVADGYVLSSAGGGLANFGGNVLVTNCTFDFNTARGGDGATPGSGYNGGPGGGGAGLGGALFSSGPSLTLVGCTFSANSALGGNGGNGNNNGFDSADNGGDGGGPNGGAGGQYPNAGSTGGFGGGGGGGSGSFFQGYDAGTGGFGGGGGGGGATGLGGNGGNGGNGGLYGGYGSAAAASVSGAGGGGAGLGGAIFASAGVVTISDCRFMNNSALSGHAGSGSFDVFPSTGGQGVGGAVFNYQGTLVASNLSFSGNTASSSNADLNISIPVTTLADSGAGSLRQALASASAGDSIVFDPSLAGQTIVLTSGELFLAKDIVIDASALAGGIAVDGNAGRIFEVGAQVNVELDRLTITNGSVAGGVLSGGGILSEGNLTANQCTIAGNISENTGGGIESDNGTLILNKCTFYNNTGANGGGGINLNGGTATVNESTFTQNAAPSGGGNPDDGGGAINLFLGSLTLNQSTITGNSASVGGGITEYDGNVLLYNSIVANNSGTMTDPDIHQDQPFSTSGINFTNGNPGLAPLGNYGGPTLTMPPYPTSPVIDACINGENFSTDQRGFPRVQGAFADIGADERSPGDPSLTEPSSFGSLASQIISYGYSVNLSGQIAGVGPVYPQIGEPVIVTIDGISVTNVIFDDQGDFDVDFPSEAIPASPIPYTITYAYAGDAALFGASDTSTTLTVDMAMPEVDWSPVPITYGDPLGGDQLNAISTTDGTFSYSPPAGTVLNAGNDTLSVIFTPTDTNDYVTVTNSVDLTVFQAPLSVTAISVSRSFGQPNPPFLSSVSGIQNNDVINVSLACSATLTSPPGIYPITPTVLGPSSIFANYSLSVVPGLLEVTSGAQTLAHDDAAAYYTNGGTWASGMNYGYGFQPWTILTSGAGSPGSSIGDGGSIATISNSAWALYADGSGSPPTIAVAYRAFSNSLPAGLALKVQWRSDNVGYYSNSFAGFSLRHGNAATSTSDYTTGERFSFFYSGYGSGQGGPDDIIVRDGSGQYYAPAPGVTFGNLSQGVLVEFTLVSSNMYRLVVMDAATSNTIARMDNLTLEGSGTIDSIALYNSETAYCDCTNIEQQVFNNLEISNPSIPVVPSVTVTPASLTVLPGATAVFTANATGTPPFVYQWQFNGNDLLGANAPMLTLPAVNISKGGHYDVVVTSPYGSVTSSMATLAVSTPTSILTPPASAQVTVGGSASFSVVAISSSALTYQWYYNGSPITGATNSSVNVSNAQLPDTGTYSVQVINAAGSIANASASLLVLPAQAPVVPTYSYNVQIHPGMNLIANQLNRGGNTLNEILPIVPDGTEMAKYDNGSGTWTINTYTANLGAWTPSSIKLNPGEGAFLISPSNFTATFSGKANVPVLPLNIPAGTAWLVSRQTNDLGTYSNIAGANPVAGSALYQWDSTNHDYVAYTYTGQGWLNGVTPSVAIGESVWIAPAGGIPSTIPIPPSITQQPVSVTVAQGGMASFTVAATGTAPLFYQWQLNGNVIPGATNAELDILDVQAANVGPYSVVVNNAIGISNSAIVTLAISGFGSLPFADDFVNAGSIGNSTTGTGTGSNLAATTEPGETIAPDEILAGATVWLKWQPLDGIASLNTFGSGFDTVLAVYTGPDVAHLQLIAADDDSGPNLTSALTFNAAGGTTYYIQVSGFKGAVGNIVLSWNLVQTANEVPQIVVQPQSQTQTNGGPVLLSVAVTNIGDGVVYQWALQGAPVPGATNATLLIPSLSPDLVGLYTVSVTNPETLAGTLSSPASVEIFNPGLAQPGNFANVHPQDKFQNAAALTPHDPNIPNDPTFAGGFTGTQIFSSAGATADAGEPNHCGYTPCHSVWYSYVPPTTGELTMSTTNNFRAILEVYSGPGSSFSNLVPVACSASGTTSGESVTFPVTAGSNYWVVIDGINCEFGSYSISYTLASPAAFTALPIGMTLTNGGSTVLATSTTGTPPFRYQWWFNGAKITGATNSSLALSNFHSANEGNYSVMTMNNFATNMSTPAAVYLSSPPRFINFGVLGTLFSLQFAGAANSNYVFQTSSNLTHWTPLITNSSPIGIINFYDPLARGVPRYYRAMKQ